MSLLSLDQIKTLYDDLRGRIEDGGSVINFLPVDNASGSIATFPDGADDVPVKSLVAQITPVQSGTGDPAPDNIRPISGWTGAKINVTGINVWDEVMESGSISPAGVKYVSPTNIRSANYIPVKAGESYSFVSPKGCFACYYDKDKTFVSNELIASGAATITIPDNAFYMLFRTPDTYGTTYNHDIAICYPSSETAYVSFAGGVISISWQTEAGTVYGGTLTYIGGGKYSLQATHKKITLDGNTTVSSSGGFYYVQTNDLIKAEDYSDKIIASNLKTVINNNYVNLADFTITGYRDTQGTYPNQNWLYLHLDSSVTTLTDYRNWLAANPVDVVYELKNLPAHIILDAEDVKTLLGDNNIFVDTGDVSVDYRADIALYIQKVVNA